MKTLSRMIFLLLALLFIYGQLLSQNNSVLDCAAPTIADEAKVFFTDGPKVYLRFSDRSSPQKVVFRSSQGEQRTFDVTDGELWTSQLAVGEYYDVVAENACGEKVALSRIHLDPSSIKDEMVEVSGALYGEIKEYQNGKMSGSLLSWVLGSDKVSKYEKLAFVQEFYLAGEPLEGESIDGPRQLALEKNRGQCLCRFVSRATHGTGTSEELLLNGSISEAVESQSNVKVSYNSDSHWVFNWKNKSAAKGHALRSYGRKAGSTPRSRSRRTEDNGAGSPYAAIIRYNFACDNFDELPSECDCVKRLKVYYHYEASVNTSARVIDVWPGWASKYAMAQSQDIAIVTLSTPNGTQLLGAGEARSASECAREVNPEFWRSALRVATAVAPIIIAFELGDGQPSQQLVTAMVTNLYNQVSQAIGEPFFLEVPCGNLMNQANGQSILVSNSGQVPEEVLFHPNEEVVLALFSFTEQLVEGKYGWDAHAFVASDFYIGAIAHGNRIAGEEACCKPRTGAWILATQNSSVVDISQTITAPSSLLALQQELGARFGAYSWQDLPPISPFTDGVMIPTEYGRTFTPVSCRQEDGLVEDEAKGRLAASAQGEDMATHQHIEDKARGTDDHVDTAAVTVPPAAATPDDRGTVAEQQVVRFAVYDMSGRQLLHKGYESPEKVVLTKEWLRGHIRLSTSGIYAVQLIYEDGGSESTLLFVD